jgi:hypothetical protein
MRTACPQRRVEVKDELFPASRRTFRPAVRSRDCGRAGNGQSAQIESEARDWVVARLKK